MKPSIWLSGAAVLFLAACQTTTTAPSGQFIQNLPEQVVALAAPYQDLTAVRVDPADGCFVYRHVGPVETTMLPLRSTKGRPICKKAANPA